MLTAMLTAPSRACRLVATAGVGMLAAVKRVLVTGMSGTGKSRVIRADKHRSAS
jgi:hypothetical protein